ncbi:hypothetical protein N7488_006848 [Penicillium malachiteum]|nr:hypothetical protein N7488_006848 [Penicillium malachiteum]
MFTIIVAVAAYLIVVQKLRFLRANSLSRKYPYDRESLAHMTLEKAFEIQYSLAELEFPFTFSTSYLLRPFQGELASPTSSSKRAADTGVLLTEIVLNKPNSTRNLDTIARMNWLHDRYRRAGKIKDETMLYTLSLFVLEPIRWTNRFEWRSLLDIERCALAVYWRSLCEAMDISYEVLPSAKSGWRDDLH